ncbi:MAG: hypothetical protein K1X54_02000 [Flavobacteriales bacterium]|nr:hypothetical protein [Flavobacteriales bacterium]
MKLLYVLLAALIFTGCRVTDPDEQEPSFIYIDDVHVITTSEQGSASHNITEVWVYANDDIVGIFDVPAVVPVLKAGKTKISVYGGIKNNGLGSTRIKYPFYAAFDTSIVLNALSEHHLSAKISYSANADVDNRRNFETTNYFVSGPNNQASLDVIYDPVLAVNGNKYCSIALDANESYLHYIDDLDLDVTAGSISFLEMDYSCDNSFTCGVYVIQDGNTEKYPVLTLVPTTSITGLFPTWNKIYLDLGGIAGSYPNADNFRFYVEANAYESTTPTILLDNIKVVK